MKSALRIDFAGGFADNVAFQFNKKSFLVSAAIGPMIERRNEEADLKDFILGSGLSISTSLNLQEYIAARGGKPYLESVSIDDLAHKVWEYENEKYSIKVGKGDVYPIVYGGLNIWECEGEDIRRLDFSIDSDNIKQFESNLLLLFSGIPRVNEVTLDEFYKNYASGEKEYLDTFQELAVSALDFKDNLKMGNYDSCGEILELNWEYEKKISPNVTNDYLDEVYKFAKNNGSLGGKMSGAGGGGYFMFYTWDRETLGKKIMDKFPKSRVQPFWFEHQDIKELNNC